LIAAPQSKPAAAAPSTPEDVVREWFRRWNALDGSEASVNHLVDLYQPACVNQTPPSSRQIGPVYMEGPEGVRKLAADFTKSFTQPAYRIDSVAAGAGKPTELFYKTQGPWGGPAIAVQYTLVATVRETKERLTLPAFAVFHIDGGKIRYARFYFTPSETKAQ